MYDEAIEMLETVRDAITTAYSIAESLLCYGSIWAAMWINGELAGTDTPPSHTKPATQQA